MIQIIFPKSKPQKHIKLFMYEKAVTKKNGK